MHTGFYEYHAHLEREGRVAFHRLEVYNEQAGTTSCRFVALMPDGTIETPLVEVFPVVTRRRPGGKYDDALVGFRARVVRESADAVFESMSHWEESVAFDKVNEAFDAVLEHITVRVREIVADRDRARLPVQTPEAASEVSSDEPF